ncbi:alpha-tocopherol transfer protein-like [Lytechinus pictus]|uniref:alpha-tocopherol transfer protein-like n=1 Tax=Lytechinus pictus TaxID=7653 RepID=UPI0030BA01D3
MASYTWTMSDNLRKKAELELGETPSVRESAIQKLRERMEERKDIVFNTDSRFLIRFLRAKKFDVDRAYKSIVKYYELHVKHPDFFEKYHPTGIKHVLDDGYPYVLESTDGEGRHIVAMKTGHWDPREYPITDIALALFMVIDQLVEDEAAQINGVILLFDLEGVNISQAMCLTPSVAKKLTSIFQNCVPVRVQGIHFINESLLFDGAFTIIKPFMQEKIRKRVRLHGQNLETLHEYLLPSILPDTFGGEIIKYDSLPWRQAFLERDLRWQPSQEEGVLQKKKKGKK